MINFPMCKNSDSVQIPATESSKDALQSYLKICLGFLLCGLYGSLESDEILHKFCVTFDLFTLLLHGFSFLLDCFYWRKRWSFIVFLDERLVIRTFCFPLHGALCTGLVPQGKGRGRRF